MSNQTKNELDKINQLKQTYIDFYSLLFTKIYKLKELPVYRPLPPIDNEFTLPNASKVFNIKHRNGEIPPIDIDKTYRDIIIDQYAYSGFNNNDNDNYLYFTERDSYRDVELTMRYDTQTNTIEVKNWNANGWLSLDDYITILLEPHFKTLDRKSYAEKRVEIRLRYDRLLQILKSKLDETFHIKDYYQV